MLSVRAFVSAQWLLFLVIVYVFLLCFLKLIK